MQRVMDKNSCHFFVDYFNANIKKSSHLSGVLFCGPIGSSFELF